MDEITLIEQTERYLNNQMNSQEKEAFEALRSSNQEIDQLVVENLFFLNQLDAFQKRKKLRRSINETVSKLVSEGVIKSASNINQGTKIIQLWSKYKKTIAVAASIAAIVSLLSVGIVSIFTGSKNNNIKPLVEKLLEQDNKYKNLEQKIDKIKSNNGTEKTKEKQPILESKFRATGFLIDVNNNYLITNAHVLDEATHNIVVENNKGEQFKAKSVYINPEFDLAIIKIEDIDFSKLPPAPFGIRKGNADLGDAIFMLGFPKQEIVYGEGYISAKNGYQMDSVFCQLSTMANEGNSGSPVINKNGELIGVISSREANAEGVVFASKSKNIYKAISEANEKLEKDKIKITSNPILRKTDRVTQIKKVQDYVFMIKGN
jgi:serine protease Do